MSSTRQLNLSVLGWLVVSLLVVVGFLSLQAAVFLPLFALGVALAVALLVTRRVSGWGAGLLLGLGAVCVVVAYVNSADRVCGSSSVGRTCGSTFTPWPWLIAAVVAVAAAVGLYIRRLRAARMATPVTNPATGPPDGVRRQRARR